MTMTSVPLTQSMRRWSAGWTPFDPSLIAEQANQEAESLRYWFRQRYNLPPLDERYLNMTDADILLEYEAGLAFDGEIIKECPVCSRKTHRTRCPRCKNPDGSPLSLSGDKQMDNIVARIEAGEEIEDLDALLRGGFEPVPRG